MLAVIAAAALAELEPLAPLAARLAQVAQADVELPPGLALARCPQPPEIVWAGAARAALSVACPAQRWRLYVAVRRAPATAAPLYKRGDVVMVHAAGTGFSVSIEAVVESEARPGQPVRLRNRISGERLTGLVGAGGAVMLAPYSSPPGGR